MIRFSRANSRLSNRETLQNQSQCPPELLKGIDEFNRQEFFECHETLEALWQRQLDPQRQLTQGIIQIAVGYYHHLRGNQAGAIKLFTRGLERIRRFEPTHSGIDVRALATAVASDLDALKSAPSGQPVKLLIPAIPAADHNQAS